MPDQSLALDKYRRNAATYDDSNRFRRLRHHCVDLLALNPGDAVLDVGCGTGLNFPLIQAAIGEQGSLIGVDLSPDMLALARQRASRHDWHNVTLIASSVETARVPRPVDAALFSLTHDIMRSPQALENAVRSVKKGGRVVAAGAKWAPWWAWPVNIAVWYFARQYTTTFEGFSRPWSHLDHCVSGLQVESHLRGTMYVAWGTREKVPDPLDGSGTHP
jgi:demethylmenaquinone methyltransferase/2-methoxy-6-polyprenyl-1,4-benzoquinol methylase